MTDYRYEGTCSCGQSSYQVNLPNPIDAYVPRACDCDFCQSRKIAYLSDPKGTARLCGTESFSKQKQGSEQASFLSCPHCHDVLAATCLINNELRGAVNAALLTDKANLMQAEPASPKRLSAKDKLTRWAQIWLHMTIQTES